MRGSTGSPARWNARPLKARLIFGLTQVGTGSAARLTVTERLFVVNALPADLGYRHTVTTRLP
jgi:hypothetical protein